MQEYFDLVFSEDQNQCCKYVMGIVHDAAAYMPDLIEYFAEEHGSMDIKAGVMGKTDIETMTMSAYRWGIMQC